MENELSKAYSEVYEILKYIPLEQYNKVPKEVINVFKTKRDKSYKVRINPALPLESQNLQRKTLILLSVLNLDYWCQEEEREEILNIYWQNEKARKNEQDEYIVFGNGNSAVAASDVGTDLVVYREASMLEKILIKIKHIFKRK